MTSLLARIRLDVVVSGLVIAVLATACSPAAIDPLQVPALERHFLSNVTVVNPGAERRSGRAVVLADGRIESIREAEPDDTIGDWAGGFVLPGLIDMHVHLPARWMVGQLELFGLLFLAHGVTTVRDVGAMDDSIFETRERVRNGELAAPRVFSCGRVIDGDPPVWPSSVVARNAEDARRIVDDLARAGADCVKVYEHLSPAALRAVREAAAHHGLRVVGHVPVFVDFEEAHLDDMQHLWGAPRWPHHLDVVERHLVEAWRELDAERVDLIVRVSLEQRISHTPTLVLYHRKLARADPSVLALDPVLQSLPRVYPAVIWNPAYGGAWGRLTPREWADFAIGVRKMAWVVRRLHGAGVPIQVGTDTPAAYVVPGASVHEELRHLVGEAGFSAEEALRAATLVPGASLGTPGLGRLEAGAPADLLVFREDPTRDLAALATLEAVFAGGRLYRRKDLEAALDRARAAFESPIFDLASVTTAKLLARFFVDGERMAGADPSPP